MAHREMNLINNWKSIWKFWSVQLNALGIMILAFADLLNQAAAYMAPSLIGQLPHAQTVAILVFGAGLIARIVNQESKNDKEQG